jgi:predicted Zn finger-like uncharacterized protein
MRITCPNCGARYEVDDTLIPETGRDVQCSNCGKGWFQARHPEPEAPEEPLEAAEDEVEARETVAETEEEPRAWTAPESVEEEPVAPAPDEDVRDEAPAAAEAPVEAPAAARPEPEAWTDADEANDEADEEPAAAALPPRKTDENVLAVLREEAEREIAERRREAQALESQPELGLAEPVERTPSRATAEAAGATVAAGARRGLLPDIDEINSTLRSDADRAGAAAGEEDYEDVSTERRRGFRMGFGLMILLAAALIGLYVGAGWLAAAFPALEPVLIAYVNWANGLSAWLDGLLAAGVDGMSG